LGGRSVRKEGSARKKKKKKKPGTIVGLELR